MIWFCEGSACFMGAVCLFRGQVSGTMPNISLHADSELSVDVVELLPGM
jgi:hypothetical protein